MYSYLPMGDVGVRACVRADQVVK